MTNTIDDQIPDLKIERTLDGTGEGLILLEQDSCGNTDRVAIHPIHLRYIAEKYGLLEGGDAQAQKTITRLKRCLLLLDDRIAHLADYLANHSDHRHADLAYEMTYATATADLSEAFCEELRDGDTVPGVRPVGDESRNVTRGHALNVDVGDKVLSEAMHGSQPCPQLELMEAVSGAETHT